jgi:hypothetical protein
MQDMALQSAIGTPGTRTMFDSTNMDDIPLDAQIVAGYPHAFPTDYARFPKALQVRIDQHGNHADDCHVADYEKLAIFGPVIRQWVQSWHLLHPNGLAAVNGYFDLPTVYCDMSNLATVRGDLVGLQYDLWIAQWNDSPTVIPGSSLHQYANAAMLGFDADASVVYDTSWGVKLAPTVATWESNALTNTEIALNNLRQVNAYLLAHLTEG